VNKLYESYLVLQKKSVICINKQAFPTIQEPTFIPTLRSLYL